MTANPACLELSAGQGSPPAPIFEVHPPIFAKTVFPLIEEARINMVKLLLWARSGMYRHSQIAYPCTLHDILYPSCLLRAHPCCPILFVGYGVGR